MCYFYLIPFGTEYAILDMIYLISGYKVTHFILVISYN